jgi:hypothetical protein
MICKIVILCARYSLVFLFAKIIILKTVPSGSFTLQFAKVSFVARGLVGGTYGMDGQLLSWPYLHSKSFRLLWLLRIVLIFCRLLERGIQHELFER